MKQAPVVRVGPRTHRGEIGVSATSGLGHYLRRPNTWRSSLITGGKLPAAQLEPLAHDLFESLVIGGQLAAVDATARNATGGRTYRLQAGCIRWLAATPALKDRAERVARPLGRVDGTPPAPDPTRVSRAAVVENESNSFFLDFYKHLALSLRGTEAREHTAQVPAVVREERERRFREGTLPVLYSSPTMELGVDSSDLNAVNLRNVPPTPANYAQRLGRAGRSGQLALVLTYCSSNSPHDQYFFRRKERMVAGQVAPPRLDLANEDLVRAHLHAV